MTDETSDAEATRHGYDLATLRATLRRFNTGCYVIMGAVIFAITVWLGFVGTDEWLTDFLVPLGIATGIGFAAFLFAIVIAKLLAGVIDPIRTVTSDAIVLSISSLLGTYLLSLLVQNEVALASSMLGVVIATAAPMAIATMPITTVLRPRPGVSGPVDGEPRPPSWATLLGGQVRWFLVGIASDLVFRLAALVLLWNSAAWLLPLVIIGIADAVLSSRGVLRGSLRLWIAPGILTAAAAAVAVIIVVFVL